MSTYDEVLIFSKFDDNKEMDYLVNSLPDKDLAMNQLFKMACIRGSTNAVDFINQEAIKANIPLDIAGGLIIATKHGYIDIVKYFISLGTDTTCNNNELIKKALHYDNRYIVYELLMANNYDEIILKEIYEYSIEESAYKILKELENRLPKLKDNFTITKINQSIEKFSKQYTLINSDEIDFWCYMVDKGGDISPLNDSLIYASLIGDGEFESVAKLLIKGLDGTALSIGAINFMVDDCDVSYKKNKEIFDEFQEYLDKQYPELKLNGMPSCLSENL